jgi:uncharacterized damage-inducible protein DinB
MLYIVANNYKTNTMESLTKIFIRDLQKLKLEIDNFKNDDDLWKVHGNISNSAGNLCLHLVGNLNHFIGAVIGNSGYIRDRDAEFHNKNIDKKKLINMIVDTQHVVSESLHHFDTSELTNIYPIQVFEKDMTYEYFLIHLISHLNYHLGQINYLRRILE